MNTLGERLNYARKKKVASHKIPSLSLSACPVA